MKTAIWCMFVLLAAVWTAGAWVAAELTQWAAQLVASGAVADLGQMAGRWSPPGALVASADLGWIQELQGAILWGVEAARNGLPFVGSALGWLVVAVWFAWGAGVIGLLGLTGLALWLRGRFMPSA